MNSNNQVSTNTQVMVDWFVTDLCNDTCKFCYAPLNYLKHRPSLEHYLTLCDKIAEAGFERITICGGEPTVVKGISEIVARLRDNGLEVILYSNAIKLETLMGLLENVSILSLPIDCPQLREDEWNRRLISQKNAFKCLEILSTNRPKELKVKVGTVVNKRNINSLTDLYRVLRELNSVDMWRIYQFSPAEMGKKHEDEYNVEANEFEKIRKKAMKWQSDRLSVSVRSRDENVGYCVIMNPWGDLFKYHEKYVPIGKNISSSHVSDIMSSYDLPHHLHMKTWAKLGLS